MKIVGEWQDVTRIGNVSFTCGYCNNKVGPSIGYTCKQFSSIVASISICPVCNHPTVLTSSLQIPGYKFGDNISKLSDNVSQLYDEARDCYSVSTFTATVLLCRKLIMHVSVEQGAEENKTFEYYVNYLDKENFIPRNSKGWVDKIRLKGNSANHQIVEITETDAQNIISFTVVLLKSLYEFQTE